MVALSNVICIGVSSFHPGVDAVLLVVLTTVFSMCLFNAQMSTIIVKLVSLKGLRATGIVINYHLIIGIVIN